MKIRILNIFLAILISTFSYQVSASTGLQTDSIIKDTNLSNIQYLVEIDSVEKGFVIFEEDTLFSIYANLGPYSPKERANSISTRLTELVKQEKFGIDSFTVTEVNEFAIISYKNDAIIYLGNEDVAIIGKNKK